MAFTDFGSQVKAARNMLGWNQRMLAEKADLSHATIFRIEDEYGSVKERTKRIVRAVLEKEGLELKGDGSVVRRAQ